MSEIPRNRLPIEPKRDGFHRSQWFLVALICVSALGPLVIALRTNINWDEFLFLSRVYEQQAGELGRAFQTGYVHFFGWLTSVGASEIDQIVLARLVYYVLLLGSATGLGLIARHFMSPAAAIVVVVSFFAFSNVLIHGTSLRADGLLLCLYILTLATLIRRPPSSKATSAAGALFGLGLFVTVKAVLLGLAIVPLLVATSAGGGRRRPLRRILLFGIAAAVTCGLATLLHFQSVSGTHETTLGLQVASRDTLLQSGLLPQRLALLRSVQQSPIIWTLLVAGLGVAVDRIARGDHRRKHLQMISLSFPLLSLLFYRNSFPYYYVVIIPPALVLLGLAYETLAATMRRWTFIPYLIPILILADAIPTVRQRSQPTMERQREILAAVHEVFPERVPYIDGVSMVPSYQKVGFFMSGWGLQRYRLAGKAIFRDLVVDAQPHFLLASASDLEIFHHTYRSEYETTSFLYQADKDFLRNQFIHHWGPIYVPGTQRRLSVEGTTWETLISGSYTVEASAGLYINGQLYPPGSHVHLEAGSHRMATVKDSMLLTLRWGRDLPIPSSSPPPEPIFIGF